MAGGSNDWRDESAIVGKAGRRAITPGTAVEASERSGARLHDRCARHAEHDRPLDPQGLDGIDRRVERSHTAVRASLDDRTAEGDRPTGGEHDRPCEIGTLCADRLVAPHPHMIDRRRRHSRSSDCRIGDLDAQIDRMPAR